MLRKLIKYEFKSINKVGSIMLLAMLAVTVIGCVVFSLPWVSDVFADDGTMSEATSIIAGITMVISFMLYIFMLVGISYGIIIYLGIHFYKTMYTEQGYLTNTLPVTAHQLLISKVLVSGIWYILIEIGIILSMLGLIVSFMTGIIGPMEGVDFREIMSTFTTELSYVFESEFGGMLIHFIVYIVLAVLLSPFCAMLMLFGALTIGQLSKKHKALMGVLAYFGISILNVIIASVVQAVFMVGATMSSLQNPSAISNMNMMGIYDSTLIIQVVTSVVLYFVAHYILTKKLNMD